MMVNNNINDTGKSLDQGLKKLFKSKKIILKFLGCL